MMVYRCGHNLDESTPRASNNPPEQQMARHEGLCARCQADTYPAHHPLGGGGFQVSEIREWPQADFINGEGCESDLTLDGIIAHSPTEDHTWPTYGGITRSNSPEMNYTKTEGGCITPEMIAAVYSPEALRRELESEFETNRQKAEMMKPYIGAPFMVHAAAWRVTLSNFGAPLHPSEAKRLNLHP